MTSDSPSEFALVDVRIDARTKLAALWAGVMAACVYGDVLGLTEPGRLVSMLATRTPFGPMTPGLLLGFIVFMSIPGVMVFLSLLLPPRASRIANIVLGVVFTLVTLMAIPVGWSVSTALGLVQAVLTASVTRLAWTWPGASGS
jgi:hypothetical protein